MRNTIDVKMHNQMLDTNDRFDTFFVSGQQVSPKNDSHIFNETKETFITLMSKNREVMDRSQAMTIAASQTASYYHQKDTIKNS